MSAALPFDPVKRHVIESIVSVFETGDPVGDYSAAVILPDGAGISYGRHQATDKSGSLDAIVRRYIDQGGQLADSLAGFLPDLAADRTAAETPEDPSPAAADLLELLRAAGKDPVMREAQDHVFAEEYWEPAARQATELELVEPLSWLSLYDLCIQSGPRRLSRLRKGFWQLPPSKGGSERPWAAALNRGRSNWLRDPKQREIVQRSAVRVDVLIHLGSTGQWALDTPVFIGHPYNVTVM